ncbi:hypothetical protein D3C72_1021530 [compost metagenome]
MTWRNHGESLQQANGLSEYVPEQAASLYRTAWGPVEKLSIYRSILAAVSAQARWMAWLPTGVMWTPSAMIKASSAWVRA